MYRTRITTRSSLATMAVMAGLLAAAVPAAAARGTVAATMLLHGDFSTFHTNAGGPVRDNVLVFSGDAHDNEMGIYQSRLI